MTNMTANERDVRLECLKMVLGLYPGGIFEPAMILKTAHEFEKYVRDGRWNLDEALARAVDKHLAPAQSEEVS